MFKRLINSLTSPKETAVYFTSSMGKCILYLLFLVILMMIPVITYLSINDSIDPDLTKNIKLAFQSEDVPFMIENGNLKNTGTATYYKNTKLNQYKIVIGSSEEQEIRQELEDLTRIIIWFGEDKITVIYSRINLFTFNYQDYTQLHNLDFRDIGQTSNIQFWDNITSLLNELKGQYRVYLFISDVISNFVYWVFWFAIFACFMAFFARGRANGALTYGEAVKISFHNLTPFVFCAIIGQLFKLGILIYIGYFLIVIYNIITVNQIIKKYVRKNGGENEL